MVVVNVVSLYSQRSEKKKNSEAGLHRCLFSFVLLGSLLQCILLVKMMWSAEAQESDLLICAAPDNMWLLVIRPNVESMFCKISEEGTADHPLGYTSSRQCAWVT